MIDTYVNLKASEVMIPDSSSCNSLAELVKSNSPEVELINTIKY